jgi:hypothetical protein
LRTWLLGAELAVDIADRLLPTARAVEAAAALT